MGSGRILKKSLLNEMSKKFEVEDIEMPKRKKKYIARYKKGRRYKKGKLVLKSKKS